MFQWLGILFSLMYEILANLYSRCIGIHRFMKSRPALSEGFVKHTVPMRFWECVCGGGGGGGGVGIIIR